MIIVATHKDFNTSILEENYSPVQVGCFFTDVDLGFLKDNIGTNISEKNKSYCELTALYYAWKNKSKNKKYLGLAHYRRLFVKDSFKAKINASKEVLTDSDINEILIDYDVILPKKRFYPFTTVKQHYCQSHFEKDILLLEELISNKYSEYSESFNSVVNSKSIHLYNMFVMKTELADEYCEWLFSVLFELESLVDISNYDSYQGRIFGFLSERLLNVWVHKNKLRVKELNVYEPDGRRYTEKALKYLKEYR
ncbi:DUF4422 domain-containing protein [Photobacterium rosenbergii]|uniref:DUF4422 domain-containing protein n=1 Tax=Photobacterium rosenbergii TaxID=294936 RepID=A0ABU3ZPZ6_9GAMM|nr:DUF4422 domain-containing protein [Photobacterium rosenbergii]MDV5172132.1 DUF4422 domain-containing protein [Photobacterium rosenbergii]